MNTKELLNHIIEAREKARASVKDLTHEIKLLRAKLAEEKYEAWLAAHPIHECEGTTKYRYTKRHCSFTGVEQHEGKWYCIRHIRKLRGGKW